MLIFGPLSSFFDFATFGVLLWLLRAGEQAFHTGWFIESVLSAGIVVFALRTRLTFTHSQPSRAMLNMTLLIAAVTLVLPYTPLAALLGLTPLPLIYLLIIFGIVVLYFISAEFTKRWFYAAVRNA
jgi:P-type Mg2+ transporter